MYTQGVPTQGIQKEVQDKEEQEMQGMPQRNARNAKSWEKEFLEDKFTPRKTYKKAWNSNMYAMSLDSNL